MDESATAKSVIGVVDDDRASTYAATLERAGATAIVDDATALAATDVDAVVAPTEATTYECVRERITAPVLAIDGTPALRGVPRQHADDALHALAADDYTTTTRRTLAVDTETGLRVRALADVMLVTSEPARISEYGLHTPEGTVSTFRADGIVVATPVGSQTYARAAGSHVLAPNTRVVSAVPIAPFATSADDWVLPDDDLTLTVERDEGDVSLRIDDRHVTELAHGASVHVTPDDPFALAATPQSPGPWQDALEKH